MRRVTANVVGVAAPGVPRRLVLALDDGATVRDLIDELTRRGGDAMRRAIWADEGRLHRFVLIAVDGEALDLDRLDGPVPLPRDGAEVSLFLIRPLFGG